MSESFRKRLFGQVSIDDKLELDYLNTMLPEMQLSNIDTITINAGIENRPDLISYRYYGNFDYGWLISHHNDIDDPLVGFYLGRVIKIPSLDEYFKFLNLYAKKPKAKLRDRL